MIVCRRAFGFWLGVRLALLLVGAVAEFPLNDLLVLRALSLSIVVAATSFLMWLDARISGEQLLLGNAGVSPEQVAATVSAVALGLEAIVYTVSYFA